ncbi:MAG TPA: IPT/TIG domain-containing protein [Solirubrobacteraceae bacterium]
MNLAGLALIAAAAVVGVLLTVQAITLVAHSSFLSTVILGEDGRTSTSKTFILLWTLLVAWALVALLIAGEFAASHACITSGPAAGAVKRCQHDDVALLQLGWSHFLHAGLTGSYLVLLGVPAAAGVAAKGITQAQARSSTSVKTVKRSLQGGWLRGLIARMAEIFSADDGSTDVADFQYLIFNLITAVYFASEFLQPKGNGLPTIPDTLLGLTSVSAGLYVGKKAVTRSQPSITSVFPGILQDGQQFTIIGTGLTVDPAAPTTGLARVTIDGVPATGVRESNGDLVATAPHNLAVAGQPVTRQLQVLSPYGGITANFPVQCV